LPETEINYEDLLIDEDNDPYSLPTMAVLIELADPRSDGSVLFKLHTMGLAKDEIIAALETALELAEDIDDDYYED
jgi:hypothetical protein